MCTFYWMGSRATSFSSICKTLLKHHYLIRCRHVKTMSTETTKTSSPKERNKIIDLNNFPIERIRNFCIIAHVDHGKSTLSDRLLEQTGTISKEDEVQQYLDKLQVEKERGITVKAQTCSLIFNHKQESYLLNLIDTPGHVDFSYEVWRSISACQGAVLLVDANSGVQAQTIAHFNQALLSDLSIIPVLNKIDLKNADPDSVAFQMNKLFEIEAKNIIKVSAKFGTGVEELLQALIERIPCPKGDLNKPFRGFVFDSWYEKYKGIILLVTVLDGQIKVGDTITVSSTKKTHTVRDIGIMYPDPISTNVLFCGQVGFVIANIHENNEVNIGDVLTNSSLDPSSVDTKIQVPYIQKANPMVFASIYPCEKSDYGSLSQALNKLILNDNSVELAKDTSPALGYGFRLGFLGLLHMEVFCQRLDQEYDAQVVITAPSVPYKVKIKGEKNIKFYGSDTLIVTNAEKLPDIMIITEYQEPMVVGTIILPDNYLNQVTNLCMERRGVQINSYYIDNNRLIMQYKFPLNEIIIDFYDALKSVSSGYASFDYEDAGYEVTDLVKLDILLNDKPVDELSSIVHAKRAREMGKTVCAKLKETLKPHQFKIKIQAKIGGKVVAREDIKAYKKDVTAKLYGGDITRRMKLLARQAEGKKRLRMIGNIEVTPEVFIKVLKR